MNLSSIKDVIDYVNKSNDTKPLDLTKFEDCKKFLSMIEDSRKNPTIKFLFENVLGKDIDDIMDSISEYATNVFWEANKINEEDKDVDDEEDIEEDIKEDIKKPSDDIPLQIGLQIHKLVGEYIDTKVKPYSKYLGEDKEAIMNNAYAGLYEFACWIYNK